MLFDDVLRIKDQKIEIDIIVSPRSSRSGVEGVDSWRRRLIVKVRSPPLDGKANKEVEEIITELTGSPAEVVSGHTARQKTVCVRGDPAMIISRLRGYNER